MTFSNKRRYFRIDKRSVISIRECDIYEELNLLSPRKKKKEPHYAKMKNISACGVLIESSRPYSIGSIVKLEIVLDGLEEDGKGEALFITGDKKEIKKIFKTIARVIRIDSHGPDRYDIGFEFLGVEMGQLEELKSYILQHVPAVAKNSGK